MKALQLLAIIVVGLVGWKVALAQTPATTDPEVAAINAMYSEWNKATAARGADGYVSFFVADAAVLPPNGPSVEGQEAIRKWIQKELDEYTIKGGRIIFGPLRVSNGWAVRRFTIMGQRVSKKGGDPVQFNNKYLDVLQKQGDGSWKFVHRMWSSNE
jgi:uncharacterized protein (TIGR02246 family)